MARKEPKRETRIVYCAACGVLEKDHYNEEGVFIEGRSWCDITQKAGLSKREVKKILSAEFWVEFPKAKILMENSTRYCTKACNLIVSHT